MQDRDPEAATAAGAWPERLATPAVRALRAYDPGHDLVALRRRFAPELLVELGSNENPYGPSPRALEAASTALGELHRYPDPLGGDLKRALAARHAVDAAQVVLGNGSHELLMQLAQVFAGIGSRLRRANPLAQALEETARLEAPLRDAFDAFFPDLRTYAETWRARAVAAAETRTPPEGGVVR